MSMAAREIGCAVCTTLLRVAGTSVRLLVPGGVAGSESPNGLGLRSPALTEVELSPALVRSDAEGKLTVLVEAKTLESAIGASGDEAAKLLESSARAEIGGSVRTIAKVSADYLGGAPYLYRLELEG